MKLIQYIALGLIQGLTEPLPISSSGHLVIIQKLINFNSNDLNLEIILNFGSLIAILIFYKKDIINIISNNYKYVVSNDKTYKKDFNYSLFIIIASIPAIFIGLLSKDYIENHLNNTLSVGISLIITSIALFCINKLGKTNSKKEVQFKDSVYIGFAQSIALIPGISRSGSTLVGGLSRGLKAESTLKFSFLMYIPISVGSLIMAILDIDLNDIYILGYCVALIVSIVATFISLKLLYSIVKKSELHYFSYYCLIVGVFSIILYF